MQRIILSRITSLALFLLFGLEVKSQDTFQWTAGFLRHLNEIEAYEEGIFFIENRNTSFKPAQEDTLNFYKGYFNYQLKQINPSIEAFKKVRPESQRVFLQAKFLTSFQQAYGGNYQGAKQLAKLKLDSSSFFQELKHVELSGISLLERDFEQFNFYSKEFSGEFYQLASVEERLKLNYEGLLRVKRKSPAIAGVISGVVPGMGKLYVGKAGEGFLTLLISTIVGLQVREAYKKDGVDSPRFKVYTGIFGALYVANIWGSVLSVKIHREEINKTYDEAILLNMHVPLRTVFD